MKIGDIVTLQKVEDNKYKGGHPNGVNVGHVLGGIVKDLPKKGEQFFMYYSEESKLPSCWTSKIKMWEGNIIETENSTYKINIIQNES